jgi:transcription elongation factor GreA
MNLFDATDVPGGEHPVAMQRIPITRAGYERLQLQLERLKREERPRITKAIAEARSHGDLAENAEYHAAREKQAFVEGRINELEAKLGVAEVIEPPLNGDRVTFGSTVRVEDDEGRELRYWIVGSDEAEPAKGRISVMSPLARTLIGKRVGDRVVAQVPGGKKTLAILAANFRWEDT